jgi:hypothetical protein
MGEFGSDQKEELGDHGEEEDQIWKKSRWQKE